MFIISVLMGMTRYDEAYFTDEYTARYSSPGPVAAALEQALRTGDEELLTELHGTSYVPSVEKNENLIFSILISVENDYFNYMYWDTRTFARITQYVTKVGERYVASEPDLYYYMQSGRWASVVGPLAVLWWIMILIYTGIKAFARFIRRGAGEEAYR